MMNRRKRRERKRQEKCEHFCGKEKFSLYICIYMLYMCSFSSAPGSCKGLSPAPTSMAPPPFCVCVAGLVVLPLPDRKQWLGVILVSHVALLPATFCAVFPIYYIITIKCLLFII